MKKIKFISYVLSFMLVFSVFTVNVNADIGNNKDISYVGVLKPLKSVIDFGKVQVGDSGYGICHVDLEWEGNPPDEELQNIYPLSTCISDSKTFKNYESDGETINWYYDFLFKPKKNKKI